MITMPFVGLANQECDCLCYSAWCSNKGEGVKTLI